MSLLARISVWTVTKRGHLLALLLSSCFTFPNPEEAVLEIKPTQYPGAVAAVGQVLALVLIPGGPRRSWQHLESLSKRQRVTYCFAPPASLGWETSPSLTWAMGYSSEEGRARKVCGSLFLGFLWCKEGFGQHAVPAGLARVSVTPRFRCIKLWGVRQRKCYPETTEQTSSWKAYPKFSKPEDTPEAKRKYTAGKNYIKHETQKLILKSFLCFPEQFALN